MGLRSHHRSLARVVAAALAVSVAFAMSAAPAEAAAPFLARLNAVRSMARLNSVTTVTDWNNGCWYHSRYQSENGFLSHSEDAGNAWYTAAGAAAAARSNVAMSSPSGSLGTGTRAIDMWAVGPFHALGMLDPRLRLVGFGLYRRAGAPDAATLNVRSGLASSASSYLVRWPGPNSTTPFLRYSGGESPDPRSSSGYRLPTGAPIILRLGRAPSVTGSSLRCGTTRLAHVVVTPTNYRSSNASMQSLGRNILASNRAVYVLPKAPLVSGRTYSVSITSNGVRYSWSFKAGTAPRAATSR